MGIKIQPYIKSKRSTNPYLYLNSKYKQSDKEFINAYEFSNARFTNIPKTFNQTFGKIGYPILKQNGK